MAASGQESLTSASARRARSSAEGVVCARRWRGGDSLSACARKRSQPRAAAAPRVRDAAATHRQRGGESCERRRPVARGHGGCGRLLRRPRRLYLRLRVLLLGRSRRRGEVLGVVVLHARVVPQLRVGRRRRPRRGRRQLRAQRLQERLEEGHRRVVQLLRRRHNRLQHRHHSLRRRGRHRRRQVRARGSRDRRRAGRKGKLFPACSGKRGGANEIFDSVVQPQVFKTT